MDRDISILVFALLILTSCQYSPYADEYTIEEPAASAVTGSYVLDKQTVSYDLKIIKDSLTGKVLVPKIEFSEDGTYRVEHLPLIKGMNTIHKGFITKKGKWVLDTGGAIDDGTGKIKHHWGMRLEDMPMDMEFAGLMDAQPPHRIIFKFGDPDAGQVMIFKKENKLGTTTE